ncbi:MAG: Xaa-Pro peptidase family protein [bacterium]
MQLTKRHLEFLTPKSEILNRIQNLQSNLQKSTIDLAWIEFSVDLTYFTGSAQSGVLLVPYDKKPVFYAKKSLNRAEKESSLIVKPYPGRKALLKKVREMSNNSGKIGLSMDVTPASRYLWLQDTLTGYEIMDISMIIRVLRAVKSNWEIQQIQEAAHQADTIFQEAAQFIHPGQTELVVSANFEKRMRELGHSGTLRIRGYSSELPVITVVSGDTALYPMNFDGPSGGEGPYPSAPTGAGWKTLKNGNSVLVDMVTSYNGYYSDQTRTFFLGKKLPQPAQHAYNFCCEVLKKLEEILNPGNICSDIYKKIFTWAKAKGLPEGFMGYGENRVRFFGHGVGLELDEFPILANKIDLKLQPGMVIAIEPKAYLKGIGALGLENTYVITDTGYQCLNKADQDITFLS